MKADCEWERLRSEVLCVDWSRPWFAPYARLGPAVAAALCDVQSLAQALERVRTTGTLSPRPQLEFVSSDLRARDERYEAYIARTAQVPVRNTLHDFFNGLVWLRFPVLKHGMATLHAQEIAAGFGAGQRSRLRDALTLLDEGGAVWAAPSALHIALQSHAWQALLQDTEFEWAHAPLWIVGHGLLQKLVRPRKCLTAHVWVVSEACEGEGWCACGPEALQSWPQAMQSGPQALQSSAEALRSSLEALQPSPDAVRSSPAVVRSLPDPLRSSPEPLPAVPDALRSSPQALRALVQRRRLPLPVLGIPGWWAPNREKGFYDDEAVFRHARVLKGSAGDQPLNVSSQVVTERA